MNEDVYKIALVVLFVLVCLTLGVLSLFAHTIMLGLKHTDNNTFVRAFQSIDRSIINPIFMIQFFAPLFLFGATYLFARSHGYSEAKYLLIGGIAYLVVVVLTVAINVPLNDAIRKVDPNASSEKLAQARAAFDETKWSISNLLRTVANTVSVVVTAIAVMVHK